MLDSLTSLSSAIDKYKIASEWWDIWWAKIDSIVRDAVSRIWNILWKNNTSVKVIIDSFDRINQWKDGEYEGRIAIMEKAYAKWDKWEFVNQILSLFWFSNPEMFILQWKMYPIVNPILGTKIKVAVILRCEKELEKRKPKKWPDLEWVSAIISAYNPTYEALISKKTGIHNIVQDELIMPLAEDAPFIQRQYWTLIAWYDKKESKLAEIIQLERKILNLGILKKRGMTNDIKKAELQISKKMNELNSIVEQTQKIKNPFSLDDIVIYIQRKFGHYIRKKNTSTTNKSDDIITSERIKSKIRRGISIGVHRNQELKQIRINTWAIIRMIKMYEKIIQKYTKIPLDIHDPQKKIEIANTLREELDKWEEESNILIDKFSFSYIQQLRDQIIEELLSKK